MKNATAKTKHRTKPELIVRLDLLINFTGTKPYLVPDVLLLGNRKGFLWLAEYFRSRAEKKIPRELEESLVDPDDHWHLTANSEPFDLRLRAPNKMTLVR